MINSNRNEQPGQQTIVQKFLWETQTLLEPTRKLNQSTRSGELLPTEQWTQILTRSSSQQEIQILHHLKMYLKVPQGILLQDQGPIECSFIDCRKQQYQELENIALMQLLSTCDKKALRQQLDSK